MSYAQFGYPYHPASQLLMSGQSPGNNSVAPSPCCESGGRTLVTDPVTGQTVFACQQCDSHSTTLVYPRLSSNASGTSSGPGQSSSTTGVHSSPSYVTYSTGATVAEQSYPPSVAMDSSAFYSSLGAPYVLKDSGADVSGWQSMAQTTGYYPYDTSMAAYGYGYDLNGARRKNATREATATLKAWLNEHKKNPYPTKGEKIMLAIITKMTLTQVSTWFANARRRLKKDNKITWDTKGKEDDDGDDDDDDDGGKSSDDDHKELQTTSGGQDKGQASMSSTKSNNSVYNRPSELKTFGHEIMLNCGDNTNINELSSIHPNLRLNQMHHRLPCSPSVSSSPATSPASSTSSTHVPLAGVHGHLLPASCFSMQEHQNNKVMCDNNVSVGDNNNCLVAVNTQSSGNGKPKIWSLADTATCKTPPTVSQAGPQRVNGYPAMNTIVSGFGGAGEWSSVQRPVVQGFPPVPQFQVSSSASTLSSPAYRSHFQPGSYNHHQSGMNAHVELFPNKHVYIGSANQGTSSGSYSADLQTDTPPQTPPNHKFPALTNYGAVIGAGGGQVTQAINCSAPDGYGPNGSGLSSSRTVLSSGTSRHHDFQDEVVDAGYMENNPSSDQTSVNNSQSAGGTAFKPVYKRALSNNDNLVIV